MCFATLKNVSLIIFVEGRIDFTISLISENVNMYLF